MDFFTSLLNTPLSVVELIGKAVEAVGDVTDVEVLKDVGKCISENAETIAK